MKKIRLIWDWNQNFVAKSMNITQQAYSFLEQGNGSPRLDTLKRFCEVTKVELSFLMAYDVPVTVENLRKFGTKGFSDLITEHKKLQQKLEFFNYLIKTKGDENPVEKLKPTIGARR